MLLFFPIILSLPCFQRLYYLALYYDFAPYRYVFTNTIFHIHENVATLILW